MFDVLFCAKPSMLIATGVFGLCGVLLLAGGTAEAQDQRQAVPSQRGTESGVQREAPTYSVPEAAGTELPSSMRSADPPPIGQSSNNASPGRAQTNANPPDMPDSSPQTPLGGTEWLAAAGAAYALNRLREEDGDEEESEDDA